jgi:hypothetical protein
MSESPVVKRVTVTFDELPMLMPPFTDQFGESEDKALAFELLRLSREIRVLLGACLNSRCSIPSESGSILDP